MEKFRGSLLGIDQNRSVSVEKATAVGMVKTVVSCSLAVVRCKREKCRLPYPKKLICALMGINPAATKIPHLFTTDNKPRTTSIEPFHNYGYLHEGSDETQ